MDPIFRDALEKRWFAALLVLIGAVSYGLLAVLIKSAYKDFQMTHVTTTQIVIGSLMLWLMVLARPSSWTNPFRGPWLQLMFIGVAGLFCTTLFFNISLEYLDASFSMVLLFQFTWITLLLDLITRRRWPTLFQLISIVIIMIGTLMAVNIIGADFEQLSVIGILTGLVSAITYSLFIFLTGRVKTDMDSVMRSAIMWTAAVPLVLIIWPPIGLPVLKLEILLVWGVVLGVLGQVIPTITFNLGIPRIGSSLSALIGSMELPAAIVFAYFILSESFGGWQWFGVVLIIAGIFVSEVRKKQ